MKFFAKFAVLLSLLLLATASLGLCAGNEDPELKGEALHFKVNHPSPTDADEESATPEKAEAPAHFEFISPKNPIQERGEEPASAEVTPEKAEAPTHFELISPKNHIQEKGEEPVSAEVTPEKADEAVEDKGTPPSIRFTDKNVLPPDSHPAVEAEREIDFEDHPKAPADPKSVELDYLYPRFTKYLGYRPSYFSISEELVSGNAKNPTFNFSTYAPLSVAMGLVYHVDPRLSIEVAFALASFHATANVLAFYTLQDSSTTVILGTFMPYYCFRLGYSSVQVCPGFGIGADGYPIMQFDSNSVLSLHSYEDMILRGALRFLMPLTRLSVLTARVGYDQGLFNSASTGIQATLHQDTWAEFGFQTAVTPKTDFQIGFRVDKKVTDFQQLPDVWVDSAMLYSLFFGFRL